jgi:hypothetical protein
LLQGAGEHRARSFRGIASRGVAGAGRRRAVADDDRDAALTGHLDVERVLVAPVDLAAIAHRRRDAEVELDSILLARGRLVRDPRAAPLTELVAILERRLTVGAVAQGCAHIQVLGRTRLASSTNAIRSARFGACRASSR